MNRNFWVLMAFLTVIRCYHLSAPVVDSHSWNQVSALSMIKHLYLDWNTILFPTTDVFYSLENPTRIYAQEFPLYQIPIAALFKLTGIQEWVARLVTIAYGMLGLGVWFLLVRRVSSERVALLALAIAGMSPLNWFYHRGILTDVSMVTAMILGFYFFFQWIQNPQHRKPLVYACLWTALAGIFKPFGLTIGVSYLALIALRRQWSVLRDPWIYFLGILAWIPTIWWILHVMGMKEGISEFGDSNRMNQLRHVELFWNSEFYIRLIFSRFIDLLLTPWAAFFCGIGIIVSRKNIKEPVYQIAIAWLAGCLFYLVVTQRGNFVHDYYQLPFVPGLTLFAALGVEKVWHWNWSPKKKFLLLGIFGFLFVLHSTRYTYNAFQMHIGSYQVGKQIEQRHQASDERMLAFDVGPDKHNQMIYYSHLYGWHFKYTTVEAMAPYRQQGARWLGVNMSLTSDNHRKYDPFLKQVEATYPKVWQSTSAVDRYQRPVLLQVYDLKSPLFH